MFFVFNFFYVIILLKEMRKIALPFFMVALYAADILAAGDVTISRVIPGKSTGLIENSDVVQNINIIVNFSDTIK